jgi:hypothetical protein
MLQCSWATVTRHEPVPVTGTMAHKPLDNGEVWPLQGSAYIIFTIFFLKIRFLEISFWEPIFFILKKAFF